jgi:hypothetical protein
MKSYKYLNPLFQILTLTISIAISTITLHAQVPNYVPTNGLVGYWPFNGNAIDESGNGNNGTLGNTISVSDRFGNPNGAYYMNDSKITLGNTFHVQSNQSYTFSAWVKIDILEETNIFSQRDAIGYNGLEMTIEGAEVFPYYGSTSNDYQWNMACTGISMNEFNLITVIFDASNNVVIGFVNGLQTGSFGIANVGAIENTEIAFIGAKDNVLAVAKFTIDDFMIHNRILTQNEITSIYNSCNVTAPIVTGNNSPNAFTTHTYSCNNNVGSAYNWTVNNGVIVSGQGTNAVDVLWGAEGTGSISVQETNTDGCIGDVVVFDVVVQCTATGNTITGPLGPETFTNSTYTCNGAVSSTYQWTITNGVIVNGQGTNSIVVLWASTGIGNVSVIETTAEGCVGTALTQDVVVVPVNVEELYYTINIYPNPAISELNLQFNSKLIGTDLLIYDAIGKEVLKQQILSTNTTINTSSFAAGNYVLKVEGIVKQVIISK